MINSSCRKCGDKDIFIQYKGMQIGLYCANCGAWQKWVGKKELPTYQRMGKHIFGEGQQVKLKMEADAGVIEPKVSITHNLGVVGTAPTPPSTPTPVFASKPAEPLPWEAELQKQQAVERKVMFSEQSTPVQASMQVQGLSEKDIESEVERRVTERMRTIQTAQPQVAIVNEESSKHCKICNGETLKATGDSLVDITIYEGVMTVTNLEGTEILGCFVIDRCPECGKVFPK